MRYYIVYCIALLYCAYVRETLLAVAKPMATAMMLMMLWLFDQH